MSIRNELLEEILAATGGGGTSMPVAPTDQSYVAMGQDWFPAVDSSTGLNLMWSSDTVNPPPINGISGNNSDTSLITELRVNKTLSSGADISFILSKLCKDNSLYGFVELTPSTFAGYSVTGKSTDEGTYYAIPVTAETAGGTPADGDKLLLGVIATENKKAHFAAITTDTVSIGTDAANPSVFPGLTFSPGTNGFTIRASDGAVRNVTGRTLVDVVGTVSFQPDKSGGGTTVLKLASQTSSDGTNWSINPFSLRVVEVSNSGETFKTSVSFAINWQNQDYIRFVCYASSGGSIQFISPTDTIGGDPVSGASLAWELTER